MAEVQEDRAALPEGAGGHHGVGSRVVGCWGAGGQSAAALGGEIEIPTLDGAANLKIPAETQSGKIFRLRGKGIKGLRGSYPGDLYCHVVVETPVKLTEHQKKLLKELDESLKKGGGKHTPGGDTWRDKLKSFFGA